MRIYICVFFFLGTLLVSCMEDKGNYDYITPNEIQIDTIRDQTIEALDTLRIPTKVTCTLDQEPDLSYVWYKYENGDAMRVDTISREKDLVYKVIDLVGNYQLYYKVIDNKTGLSAKADFRMTVVGKFGAGLMVLGTTNGSSSLVFINAAGNVNYVYGDAGGSAPGDKPDMSGALLGKNPVCVGNATNPYIVSLRDIMVLCDDGHGGAVLSNSDFTVSKDIENVFLVKPQNFKPQSFYRSYNPMFGMGLADFIVSNGKLHIRPTYMEGDMGNTLGFKPEVAGDYELCPYAIVCPAAYVFADNKNNGRLLIIRQGMFGMSKAFVPLTSVTDGFNPSSLGMTCVYLTEAAAYSNNKSGYGIFRDNGSGQLYGLRFSLKNYADDWDEEDKIALYEKTAITSQAAGIESAGSYAMSLARPHLYYSNGSKVYFYGLDNNQAYPVYDVDTVKGLENSVIDKVYMEYYTAGSQPAVAYGSTSDTYNKVLYISSHKEGEQGRNGTIHVVKLADNGTVEARTALRRNVCGQTVSMCYKR